MTVNLDRLREAMVVRAGGGADWDAVFGAVDVVLAAPRVWLCRNQVEEAPWPGCRMSGHEECRWVVLVPVEGEGLP